MRTIEFRGKSMDYGCWIHGSLRVPSKIVKDYIIRTHDDSDYKVLPETIGQFTGLLDKNNKKIYEGDITRIELLSGEVRYFTTE